MVLDTRNYYEYDYGTFSGAEHLIFAFPPISRKFLQRYGDAKDKTYLMFCTGGIVAKRMRYLRKKKVLKTFINLMVVILKYFADLAGDHYLDPALCLIIDGLCRRSLRKLRTDHTRINWTAFHKSLVIARIA